MARTKKAVAKTEEPGLRAPGPALLAPLIFLIGSRGSGKTTAARLLADRLGWMWVDADDVVENRHGNTIKELFAADGEEGFRDKEAAVLADLVRMRRHVVATGGGVVLRPENRELLGRSGWCVWLCADVETLFERIQEDPTTPTRRPQLTAGGIKEIAEVLKAREELYRACANCTVQTASRSPDDIVAEILREWAALEARK